MNRVSYGLLLERDMVVLGGEETQPKSRMLLAVPFMGKDTPSRAAEFAQVSRDSKLTRTAYQDVLTATAA